jgi:AcrR family transcriptional regulator
MGFSFDVCGVNICIERANVYDVNMKAEKPHAKVGYHHGHLREALLAAGLDALKTQSASELSLRALAKALGVTANAIYRHFADKDALLNAIAAEGFRRFAKTQREAVAMHGEPGPGLMASGRAYIRFSMDETALFKLMFERITLPQCDGELVPASLDALSVLLDCVAELVGAPADDERTRVAAAAAWGMVHGLSELAMGKQLSVLGLDTEALLDKVMESQVLSYQQGGLLMRPGG